MNTKKTNEAKRIFLNQIYGTKSGQADFSEIWNKSHWYIQDSLLDADGGEEVEIRKSHLDGLWSRLTAPFDYNHDRIPKVSSRDSHSLQAVLSKEVGVIREMIMIF